MRYRAPRRRVLASAAFAMAVAAQAGLPAAADGDYPTVGTMVPPRTKIRIRIDRRLSSATSRTGQNFQFTVLDPIRDGRRIITRAGAHGSGYVVLAGHSGINGHEGDLTLRLDTIPTVNHRILACDEQLEMNGKKLGLLTGLLGFVPVAGPMASLIQGSDRTIARGEVLNVRFMNFAKVVAPAAEVDAAARAEATRAEAAQDAPVSAPARPPSQAVKMSDVVGSDHPSEAFNPTGLETTTGLTPERPVRTLSGVATAP